MQKKIVSLFFIFLIAIGFSQENLPQDYFINPLKVPLVLSGTFGELRSNHFHAGLDIKTQQREGLDVLAVADGYISRISVAHWGYGNALYVTHPNGYTSVYAHLKKFSPKIEAYVKKKQYQKESFEIKLYPKASEILLKQGEVIALSGNSGSSGGPHLHFEIRDRKSRPMNPMLFGIDIADHKKPTLQAAFAYSRNDTSQVNQSNRTVNLNINRLSNGNFKANTVYAYGQIGIGINAFDRLDGAINKNGLYQLQLKVNGEEKFEFKAYRFSFDETRWINSYIDYSRYARLNQRVQKCFVNHAGNKLSLYQLLKNKGYFEVKDSLDYQVEVIAKDFKGNTTSLNIPIKGRKDTTLLARKIKQTPYHFKKNQTNYIKDSLVQVTFPKGTFYEDFYFDYHYNNGVAQLHDYSVPAHRYFRLTFNVSQYPLEERGQLYLARINKYNKSSYLKTRHKEHTISASSKTLGKFTVKSDKVKPKIYASNFKSGQTLQKTKTLVFRISDKGSGIKSYRGEINGQWILLEYKPKRGTLTYRIDDDKLSGLEHHIKIVVKDNVNNTTTYTGKFNRNVSH